MAMIFGFLKLTHLNNDNPMYLRVSSIIRVVVRDDGVTVVYTHERNDDNRPRYHLVKETPAEVGVAMEETVRYDGALAAEADIIYSLAHGG
jgi:hypothetical protein